MCRYCQGDLNVPAPYGFTCKCGLAYRGTPPPGFEWKTQKEAAPDAKLKTEWYDRGYRQARKELRDELCRVLGLDDRYKREDA